MKWSNSSPAIRTGRASRPALQSHRGGGIPASAEKKRAHHSSPFAFAFSFAFAFAFLLGCGPAPVERIEWTTMGTVAALQTRGRNADFCVKACLESVQECFADIEKLLNAHDPASELRRLAPLSESEILSNCTESVRPCYVAAFRLMHESGGAFNPRWRGPDTLDLGAIAKGYALDLAQSQTASPGAEAFLPPQSGTSTTTSQLLDLGGNLKSIRGTWKVGIAGSDTVIVLTNGMACATSAEYYRGKHIYDGRTGLAVSNGLTSVTVVHPTSAMLADGLSTTLFILGKEEGEKFLKAHYPDAIAYWKCQ